MKSKILLIIIAGIFGGCTVMSQTPRVEYIDGIYFNPSRDVPHPVVITEVNKSNETIKNHVFTKNNQTYNMSEMELENTDTTLYYDDTEIKYVINNYYEGEDIDFSYRIYRFHRPHFYGSLYWNNWLTYDPYYWNNWYWYEPYWSLSWGYPYYWNDWNYPRYYSWNYYQPYNNWNHHNNWGKSYYKYNNDRLWSNRYNSPDYRKRSNRPTSINRNNQLSQQNRTLDSGRERLRTEMRSNVRNSTKYTRPSTRSVTTNNKTYNQSINNRISTGSRYNTGETIRRSPSANRINNEQKSSPTYSRPSSISNTDRTYRPNSTVSRISNNNVNRSPAPVQNRTYTPRTNSGSTYNPPSRSNSSGSFNSPSRSTSSGSFSSPSRSSSSGSGSGGSNRGSSSSGRR